jgi:hypothetical protein
MRHNEVSTAVIGFDLPVMIAVAVVCLPIFFTGGVISRSESALLLGYYIAYTLYLVLASSHHHRKRFSGPSHPLCTQDFRLPPTGRMVVRRQFPPDRRQALAPDRLDCHVIAPEKIIVHRQSARQRLLSFYWNLSACRRENSLSTDNASPAFSACTKT